jgi:hypothetical protein
MLESADEVVSPPTPTPAPANKTKKVMPTDWGYGETD